MEKDYLQSEIGRLKLSQATHELSLDTSKEKVIRLEVER